MNKRIKYSPLELTILKNIPEDGRIVNTIELVNKCYLPDEKPVHARQSILDSANKLIFKSDQNLEEWEIFKSTSKGAQPIYFWREKRKEMVNATQGTKLGT